ncbi:cytochrome c nitrite reductase small subunit [Oleidesulfovibrio sp.]|uniref:cytochrome c nitrite reductase small subunit n=1 Tax=Oleidesulfovibrio sp. TaxID=2909707 RepID=UPI003A85E569
MNSASALRYCALAALTVAVVMGVYLAKESKATSYLSSEATACINCHVMESYYSTWMHSSHAQRAKCVDCHLPVENYIDKYASKARDGWNHSVAFTFNTYGKRIMISDDGARRVQENCIHCHSSFAKPIIKNVDRQHAFDSSTLGDRKCWDCHRMVPHGKVRSINATPNSLAVKQALQKL